MLRSSIFLFFALVLYSCHSKKDHGPYRGYEAHDASTYFKYVGLGIKTGRISRGKTMEVYMNYARMNDSVFWDSRDLWYPFTILLSYDTIVKSNNYLALLLRCNEGDSLNFIMKKSKLFTNGLNPHYLIADTMVKVHLRIVAILDSNEMNLKMNKYAILAHDKEMKEDYELKRYLMLNKVPDSDKNGDVFIIPIKEGSGPEVNQKSDVSVSYRGYFMNNKTFDSIPLNDPLTFNLADSGQVISGLEKGIKKMREGEVAKIIIPSHSAFGEKGSSTGIVPPYTTLVYEVTMVKVKRL